ncbi:ribosome-associated, sigma 54 modulation protein [Legionella geestiana]|uniref:Ribosome hibernation promoting factor n=1 Tax=Legionella geestiana TaxID=45065 RepID=A0A0W0U7P7_9GAMM|nr:ribosome-associated translation inhibitor RaiA [Legionella geestiana]KTD03777.1 ribosome-associated, sigma 54 modulation protein [Legionella geestiana]QBS11937.1 ribosome-associated translation inhibitor RaiA [Legionella geestiana]QDQ40450.1 ribosome-associated translation inhibitor RaiA [Legionella geestiana]STX53350.1 ribosome-associated, sigma 54 modulation protein [Legionella geestiana]
MHINFTGHHLEITPPLKAYAQEKFDKLGKHFDKITSVNVVFDVSKLRQTAEATIHVARGDIHASSESDDLYSAIDLLVEKLDRQIIRHKEKMQDHRE